MQQDQFQQQDLSAQRRSPRNNEEVPIPQTFDFSTKTHTNMGQAKHAAKSGISGLASTIAEKATGLKNAIFGKND